MIKKGHILFGSRYCLIIIHNHYVSEYFLFFIIILFALSIKVFYLHFLKPVE
jgi:hypothetical protein